MLDIRCLNKASNIAAMAEVYDNIVDGVLAHAIKKLLDKKKTVDEGLAYHEAEAASMRELLAKTELQIAELVSRFP